MSDTTHPSLLSRLRDTEDHAAWREFDSKYGDLVLRFCISRGLQHSDAEDVRQLVMLGLFRVLPGFRYSAQRGRFRNYLGTVVRNAITLFQRGQRPHGAELSLHTDMHALLQNGAVIERDEFWDQEWVRHHYRLAMQTLRATYEPRSIEIFDRLLAGQSVAQTAAEMGVSEDAVNKVKQRIRNRLREIIAVQIRHEEDSVNESPADAT